MFRRPFYDGSRGTYDEDVTLHEVCMALQRLGYMLTNGRWESAMRMRWCSLCTSSRPCLWGRGGVCVPALTE